MTRALFDPDQRRTAARIAQHSPQWVVLWGTHTRRFWAFPRFHAPPGTITTAPGTAELTTRMQHTELAARAHMPRPPQTPRTTSQPTQGNGNA